MYVDRSHTWRAAYANIALDIIDDTADTTFLYTFFNLQSYRRWLWHWHPPEKKKLPIAGPIHLSFHQLYFFSKIIIFFSYNKSANNIFQLIFSAKRTGPLSPSRERVRYGAGGIQP
jgi:hypothetical protein